MALFRTHWPAQEQHCRDQVSQYYLEAIHPERGVLIIVIFGDLNVTKM